MGLEDIKEVKECKTQDEVNDMLSQGNWRLLEVKLDKVRVPVGKEAVGTDYGGNAFSGSESSTRYEVKYEERIASLYVLGRNE